MLLCSPGQLSIDSAFLFFALERGQFQTGLSSPSASSCLIHSVVREGKTHLVFTPWKSFSSRHSPGCPQHLRKWARHKEREAMISRHSWGRAWPGWETSLGLVHNQNTFLSVDRRAKEAEPCLRRLRTSQARAPRASLLTFLAEKLQLFL